MMSGVVDPETLYTKQNCIGSYGPFWELYSETDSIQVVAVLGKCTKGQYLLETAESYAVH